MLYPPLTDEKYWTTRTSAEWEQVRSEDLVASFRVSRASCGQPVRSKVLLVLFERVKPIIGHRVENRFFHDVFQIVCQRLWLDMQEGAESNEKPGGPHLDFANSVGRDAIDAVRPLIRQGLDSGSPGDPASFGPRGLHALSAPELIEDVLDHLLTKIDDPIDEKIFKGAREGMTLATLVAETKLSRKKVVARRDILFSRLRRVVDLREVFALIEARRTPFDIHGMPDRTKARLEEGDTTEDGEGEGADAAPPPSEADLSKDEAGTGEGEDRP